MADELLEPFERLLAENFPPVRLCAIAAGEDWQEARAAVEASGFLDALAPEGSGGAGLSLTEVAPLLIALGRHGVPVELSEAILARGGADGELAAALARAAAIAGAAERVLDMTIAYANQRAQFGKPIGAQQAVQQQLAVMAEDVVAVRIAVELGCRAPLPTSQGTALAKAIASEAAPRIANTAHAVHGAIGISEEYDLQLYTRAMHAWRLEAGSESYWNARLGAAVLASDDSAVDWVRAALL